RKSGSAQTCPPSQVLALEQLVALRKGRDWFDPHRHFRDGRNPTGEVAEKKTSKTAPLPIKGCGTQSYYRAPISVMNTRQVSAPPACVRFGRGTCLSKRWESSETVISSCWLVMW